MQYEVETPEQYMQTADKDWRWDKLLELRGIIQSIDASLVESVEYKMLAYGYEDENIFHLNIQQNYVSLYAGDLSETDPSGLLLKGLNTGKSCIRVNKTRVLSETKIYEFIEERLKLWKIKYRYKD